MKNLILVLLAVFSTTVSHAEESKFDKAVREALLLLDNAKTPTEMQEVIGKFTRIAQAEGSRWEGHYYLAYSQVNYSFWLEDAAKKDALLDEAQKGIDHTHTLGGDKSELLALQAFLYLGQMQANPMRGMTLSQKVVETLNEAIRINPENPRAYFLLGQNTFHTPSAFGGGSQNALPLFEKAAELFEKENREEILPSWGSGANDSMLQACRAN